MSSSTSLTPLLLRGEHALFDNDCACPMPPVLSTLQSRKHDQFYVQVHELHLDQLTNDWLLCCNTLAGGAPAVLNTSAVAHLNTFATPRRLMSELDEQFAAANLIAPVGTRFTAPQGQPDTLTAWLHVTNACNLDCPYCYVRKSRARMTFETGINAINAIITTAQRHNFSTINLKFAGGEAVLHYRMVQQLHEYAIQHAQQHGLMIKAVVLS